MKRKNFLIATMLGVGLLSSLSSAAQQVVRMTTGKVVGSAMTLVVNSSVQGLTVDWGDGNPQTYTDEVGDLKELSGTTKGTDIVLSSESNLLTLICADMELTTLDVSGAKTLKTLCCQNNALKTLALNGLSSLTDINCANNEIETLNLSAGFGKLENINLAGNKLNGTFVVRNACLQHIDISNNEYTTLYVSNNPNLNVLNCSGNALTKIDLSKSPNTAVLIASDNKIDNLTVNATDGLPKMAHFIMDNNQLKKLDLTKSLELKTLSVTSNVITELQYPAVKADAYYIGGNSLIFAQFPEKRYLPAVFVANPQSEIDPTDQLAFIEGKYYACMNPEGWDGRNNEDYILDLSSYRVAPVNNNQAKFVWYSVDQDGKETVLVQGNSSTDGDYTNVSGKITFTKEFENIYAKITHGNYSDAELKTVHFGVKKGISAVDNVMAGAGEKVRVSVANGVLSLLADAVSAAKIFTVDGKLVWSGMVDGVVTLTLPTGVYVVNGKKVVL